MDKLYNNSKEFDTRALVGCLHLQVDWICPSHTSAFSNLLWRYGSKTAFLPTFGFVVIFTFDFWTLNFQEGLTLTNKSFPLTKVPTWYIWMELWLQNWIFAYIWSCGELDLQPVKPKVLTVHYHIIIYTSTQPEWIPFMHSGVIPLTRFIWMDGQTDGHTEWTTRKHKMPPPP